MCGDFVELHLYVVSRELMANGVPLLHGHIDMKIEYELVGFQDGIKQASPLPCLAPMLPLRPEVCRYGCITPLELHSKTLTRSAGIDLKDLVVFNLFLQQPFSIRIHQDGKDTAELIIEERASRQGGIWTIVLLHTKSFLAY